HAVALKADGTVWDWGYNTYGQLGDGSTSNRYVAVQPGVSNAISVAAGQYHTLAVKMDGAVMAWGKNDTGQLGDGTNFERHTPVAVINLTGVVSVSAGTYSVALKSDGTVWSFGTNSQGQLGNGTNVNSNVPVQVVNLILGPQVATPTLSPEGGFYLQAQNVVVSCATAGTAIHYTTNGNDPTVSDPIIPSGSSINISSITFLRAKGFETGFAASTTKSGVYHIGGEIAAGVNHSLAITEDGALWSWGYNNYGQLGLGDAYDRW